MSYQIKSTPFFLRMVNTSKTNGQLQQLKEEYERMRDFDERPIESRMRELRLKRLFREIEEINESSMQQWKRRQRIITTKRLKTPEEVRVEMLIKAKELGKQYSKMNALVDRCGASRIDNGTAAGSGHSSRSELERKTRSARRNSYGNDRSRINIQKVTISKRKVAAKASTIAAKSQLMQLKEKLRQRLSFGNSCSSRNMVSKKTKKVCKTKSNADMTVCLSFNDDDDAADSVTLVDESRKDAESVGEQPSVMTLTKSAHVTTTFDVLINTNSGDNANTTRSTEHWLKLVDHMGGYQLRTIPNNTNLPMCQLNFEDPSPSEKSEDGSDRMPDEVLLSVESLNPVELQPLPEPNPLTLALVKTGTPGSDDGSNSMDCRRKVQQDVKPFEPIAGDVARKQLAEYSIEKLRSIFEYHKAAE